jgi:hypothetical protein
VAEITTSGDALDFHIPIVCVRASWHGKTSAARLICPGDDKCIIIALQPRGSS